jgi:hypothetical protein
MFDGPISMLGSLDPDLFVQIRILQRAILQFTVIGVRVVAKSAGSENPDLTSLVCYFMDRSFRTADFQTVEGVLES